MIYYYPVSVTHIDILESFVTMVQVDFQQGMKNRRLYMAIKKEGINAKMEMHDLPVYL